LNPCMGDCPLSMGPINEIWQDPKGLLSEMTDQMCWLFGSCFVYIGWNVPLHTVHGCFPCFSLRGVGHAPRIVLCRAQKSIKHGMADWNPFLWPPLI
jgi:hypothetical protein